MKIINRKARFDYEVLEELECGLCLRGHEIKSLRAGKANIGEAYCTVRNHELFLLNSFITKYDKAMDFDTEEKRERKLLAHKLEIRKLEAKVKEKGLTLIPLEIYFKNGKAKLSLGLCRGKHLYDKRESLKKNDVKRQIDRLGKEGLSGI